MRNVIFLFLIVMVGVLQAVLSNYIKAFRVSPDVLLLCVVLAGLFFEWRWALVLSLVSGILKDSFGVSPAGMFTLLFPALCLITLQLSRKITIDAGPYGILYMFIITMVNNVCVRIILGFWGAGIAAGMSFRIVLLDSLFTAILFPITCALLRPIVRPVE